MDAEKLLCIEPLKNWSGVAKVTIRAINEYGEVDDDAFQVTVIPDYSLNECNRCC